MAGIFWEVRYSLSLDDLHVDGVGAVTLGSDQDQMKVTRAGRPRPT